MTSLPWWAMLALGNAVIVLGFFALYWVEVELVGLAAVSATRRGALVIVLLLAALALGGLVILGIVVGTAIQKATPRATR